MIGFAFVVMLLAAPPPKGVRPPTQEEEDEGALKAFESKEGKAIPMWDAGAPQPPFRWKLSNILRESPIDGIQMVNDVPVKLHSVTVKGRLADVVEEIYLHFVRSGLYMEPINKQDQPLRQVQVTALDSERAISYTAMVDAMVDGTCMVVLGEANIGEGRKAELFRQSQNLPEKTDFAPLMPQALGPTRVSIEGMKTLSFQVKATEADARKFYREQLKTRGYTPADGDVFQKKTEEILLSMTRDKELLNVLLTSKVRTDDRLMGPP